MEKKKVILGVSGGIAAYKACDLASLLTKEDIEVHTILTESAKQFITPLAFKTITYNQVYCDQFDYEIVEPLHIELCKEANLLLLVPATANLIAKLANGICDDLLTTIACAYKGPRILAPAMNTQMWENSILQENINKLKDKLNYQIIEPIEGELACRTKGIGKLAQIETIFEESKKKLSGKGSKNKKKIEQEPLSGLKVLVTAGGTREPIDPVRFIGNRSSGKMGLELAEEANSLGAEVVLITTQNNLQKEYTVIEVETAHDLQQAVEEHFDNSQILIMSAAVSDFRPIEFQKKKIKKGVNSDSDWTLPLTKNPDILETLGRIKKPEQILIGFAAESDDLIKNAKKKLKNKKLDLIVANEITKQGIGFQSDYNEVYLLTSKDNEEKILPKAAKSEIAHGIWNFIRSKFL
ncbi:MAG: bifunctional phosphopantothenoylcysteine decarboxylase/phosphopantothenate--cysteine ligase CoaBC [Candidatus Caenarcaniphilales bacterium]|nr:bifunctional phosphopantothenoylcysteine decarboxylase/phosphopantothenate--cysteine ligase CoaBC [Candidatus Caenarcaniphilales bacterium]